MSSYNLCPIVIVLANILLKHHIALSSAIVETGDTIVLNNNRKQITLSSSCRHPAMQKIILTLHLAKALIQSNKMYGESLNTGVFSVFANLAIDHF